jgi:hypothetical protein
MIQTMAITSPTRKPRKCFLSILKKYSSERRPCGMDLPIVSCRISVFFEDPCVHTKHTYVCASSSKTAQLQSIYCKVYLSIYFIKEWRNWKISVTEKTCNPLCIS